MTDIITYLLFVDGSCWPNPNGNMGVGLAIYKVLNVEFKRLGTRNVYSKYQDSKIIEKFSYKYPVGEHEMFQKTSNNLAEHLAIKHALKFIEKFNSQTNDRFIIFSDNLMAVNQVNKDFRINEDKIYAGIAKENVTKFQNIKKNIQVFWIPRNFNQLADKLAEF